MKRFAWHHGSFGKLSHSGSVSLMFHRPLFCICCNSGIPTICKTSLQSLIFFVISRETRLVYPLLGVLCCCIQWHTFPHIFWPYLKRVFQWFFISGVAQVLFVEPLVSGCTRQDCIRMRKLEDWLTHLKGRYVFYGGEGGGWVGVF